MRQDNWTKLDIWDLNTAERVLFTFVLISLISPFWQWANSKPGPIYILYYTIVYIGTGRIRNRAKKNFSIRKRNNDWSNILCFTVK